MPHALTVAPALLLGGVLIASGLLKLRGPADLHEFEQLGVPAPLHRLWIVRAHPWGEVALGILLWSTGSWLGGLVGAVATVLMGAYLVLVVRARRATPDASCACFGSTKKITTVTIVRNAWLTLLGVLSVASAAVLPLWGGALAGLTDVGWAWVAVVATAVVTTVLILWPEPPPASPPATAAPAVAHPGADDDQLEYVRLITPAISVQLADGSWRTLRELAAYRPVLMLAVSATCASCASTIASRGRWRELLPEVDVRVLVTQSPEASDLLELEEPMSLHDASLRVAVSLGYYANPSAVLFGIDGLLAGGPVTGAEDIEEFVGDIYESLHGVRPPAV